MSIQRIFTVLLCGAVFFYLLPDSVRAEEPALPCTSVLMEAETGTVLAEQQGDVPVAMGTMAKLMTVLLTADAMAEGRLQPETLITASAKASQQPGAVIWLSAGEKMCVSDLLQAVIIGNAGDAAVALAEAVSGSEEAFVLDMNARAFDLGLRQTRFESASGHEDSGVTTARELALICRALLDYPALQQWFCTWRSFLRGEATELVSENTLTRTYEGLLGFKASHGADGTHYGIAAAAERNGMTCIAVVLDCPDGDSRFSEAKSLLAKGFAGWQITTADFSGEFLRPISVRHGTDSAVELTAGILPALAVKQGGSLSVSVLVPLYITAPVAKGQSIGSAAFYCDDTLLLEAPLYAAESVARITVADAFRRLWQALL